MSTTSILSKGIKGNSAGIDECPHPRLHRLAYIPSSSGDFQFAYQDLFPNGRIALSQATTVEKHYPYPNTACRNNFSLSDDALDSQSQIATKVADAWSLQQSGSCTTGYESIDQTTFWFGSESPVSIPSDLLPEDSLMDDNEGQVEPVGFPLFSNADLGFCSPPLLEMDTGSHLTLTAATRPGNHAECWNTHEPDQSVILEADGQAPLNSISQIYPTSSRSYSKESHARKSPAPISFRTEKKTVYVCTFSRCNKRFSRIPDLQRHHRGTHDGAKDFLCQTVGCDRAVWGFPRKDKRDDHERKVHKRYKG